MKIRVSKCLQYTLTFKNYIKEECNLPRSAMMICYSTIFLNSTLLYLHRHFDLYLYLYPIALYFTLLRVERRKMLRVELTTSTLLYKTFDGKQGGVACGYTRIKQIGWLE